MSKKTDEWLALRTVGITTGLWVGILEAARISVAPFGLVERALLWISVVSIWTVNGLLLGLLLDELARLLRSRLTAKPALLLASSLYAPWLFTRLTAGHRMQASGYRVPLVLLSSVAAVFAVWLGVWFIQAAKKRSIVAQRTIGVIALAATIGIAILDAKFLPRLYPPFHEALAVMAVFVSAGAVSLLVPAAATRVFAGRWLVLPALVLVICLFALRKDPLSAARLTDARFWTARITRWLPLALTNYAPFTTPPVVTDRKLTHAVLLPGAEIIFITVDAWRYDHSDAAHMPKLARWRERALVFERAYSAAPHTSFSITSLLSGRYVHPRAMHGEPVHAAQMLGSVCGRHGYLTRASYPPAVFFIDPERLSDVERNHFGFSVSDVDFSDAQVRLANLAASFANAAEPRCLWAHLFEPHEPYEFHEAGERGTKAASQPRYQAELRYVDGQLDHFLTQLEQGGRSALVVLAADHGEAFGEHDSYYHGTTLYDEQLHVPLWLIPTGVARAQLPARTIATPVSTVDVLPTVASLVGFALDEVDGIDQRALLLGQTNSAKRAIFADLDELQTVIDGDEKLIVDGASGAGMELYDLGADPNEQNNLVRNAVLRTELQSQLGMLRATFASVARREPVAARATQITVAPSSIAAGKPHDAAALLAQFKSSGSFPERQRLLVAIGQTHDARALPVLLPLLDDIRLRLTVVRALGELGQAGALPSLLARVSSDPYVSVRIDMVRAIASLGRRDAAAQAALAALCAEEAEPAVRKVLLELKPSPCAAH